MTAPAHVRLPRAARGILAAMALAFIASRAAASAGGGGAELAGAWQRVATLDYAGAAESFAVLEQAADARVREAARYGGAVTLLNLPPTTAARVAEARRRFEELWTGAEDAGVKAGAGYHLARVLQVHQPVPDHRRALQVYAEVEAFAPASLYGQLALAQQGIWDLFSERRPPDEVRRRVEHWVRRAEALRDRAVRRNFLLCLTAAEMLFDAYEPARMVPILQEIQGLGHVRDDMQQIVARRLAFAAEGAGDLATARAAWQRLVDRYPRDPNRQFYLDRLRQIDRGEPLSPPTP